VHNKPTDGLQICVKIHGLQYERVRSMTAYTFYYGAICPNADDI